MIGLRIEINRFVEEGQPNVVECAFIDAHGKEHLIVEKVPVVSSGNLNADSPYPRTSVIACRVIQTKRLGDSEIVEIDMKLPWSIESIAGQSCFDVFPEQLIEFKE